MLKIGQNAKPRSLFLSIFELNLYLTIYSSFGEDSFNECMSGFELTKHNLSYTINEGED